MSEKKTLLTMSRDLVHLSISYMLLAIQTAAVSVLPSLTTVFLHMYLLQKYTNNEDSSMIISDERSFLLSYLIPLLVVMYTVVILGYVFKNRLVQFLYDSTYAKLHANPTMRQLHHVPDQSNPVVRLLAKQKSGTYGFFLPLPFVLLLISTIQILIHFFGLFGMEPLNNGTTFYQASDLFCTVGMFAVFFTSMRINAVLRVFHEVEFPTPESTPNFKK